MRRELIAGVAAGAVGTVALNISTYLDMVIRGRSPSSMPEQAAGKLAGAVGWDLSGNDNGEDETAQNRKSGLGALLGFATGLGVGALYGALRSQQHDVPWPLAGVGVGFAAMAGSDVPLTALRLTDPREWSVADWLSDVLPHLAYGFATALAYESFGD